MYVAAIVTPPVPVAITVPTEPVAFTPVVVEVVGVITSPLKLTVPTLPLAKGVSSKTKVSKLKTGSFIVVGILSFLGLGSNKASGSAPVRVCMSCGCFGSYSSGPTFMPFHSTTISDRRYLKPDLSENPHAFLPEAYLGIS